MTAKTMAAVLAEHAFTERDSMYCKADGCFWHYDPEDDLDRLIAEHQQDMLSAAGFGLVADTKAEAWDEGHHDGAVDAILHMENSGAKTTPNPYRAAS